MSAADERYVAEHGEPRNLPDDHPDRWQWEYRGTRDERSTLLGRLAGVTDDQDGPPQDEELFS